MSPQEEKEFVAGAFQKLKERGWFPKSDSHWRLGRWLGTSVYRFIQTGR